jgi:hypothetical protein
MITGNITLILYVTGIITCSMLLLFIAPKFVMQNLLRLKADEGLAGLIERHWGMGIFVTGLLLIWAGYDPALRTPVIACVALNKATFVGMMLANYKKGYMNNFSLIMAFDTACVFAFVLYLLGWS